MDSGGAGSGRGRHFPNEAQGGGFGNDFVTKGRIMFQ